MIDDSSKMVVIIYEPSSKYMVDVVYVASLASDTADA